MSLRLFYFLFLKKNKEDVALGDNRTDLTIYFLLPFEALFPTSTILPDPPSRQTLEVFC